MPFTRHRYPLLVTTLLFLLFPCTCIRAQNPSGGQTVKGVVVDKESLLPLIAASIYVVGSEPPLGATTDENGRFRIENVPLGRRSLIISSIGYEDGVVQEIVVGSGKEVDLKVQLTESLIDLSTIEVVTTRLNGTPNDEMATVSAQSFSVEQTKRYAAAINDPARMALSFAGVASGDDESNEIIIRGNSPRGLLWRMEGIEIPNPNHFSEEGASGGGISALSVNVLANSDFYTGAFPAQYGNASSGVFDLRLREGNSDKREYAFQAGVLGIDVAAEGPIGPKGGASYLANYRYSTLAVLESFGVTITGEGSRTTFQDATFKLHFPNKKGGYLSVWGLGGISGDRFQLEGDPETSSFQSNRGVVGVNYFHRLSEKSYLESIVSYSATRSDDDYNSGRGFVFDDRFVNRALRGSLRYNQKVNARQTFQAGIIGHQLGYELLEEIVSNGERTTNLSQDGNTYFLQGYAQYKYRLGTNVTATGGIHASYFGLEGQQSVEPRLGLRWNYKPGHSVNFGAGLHSRLEALSVYLAEVEQPDGSRQRLNRGLPLQQAAHLVVGHNWRFHKNWRWKVEAYYQEISKVAIATAEVTDPYGVTESSINFSDGFETAELAPDGTGRNFGVESTVERFFTGGWYALAATSLFRSRYTPRDGIERPTRFASDFVQTVLAGKEWTIGKQKINTIGLNLRLSWSGNNREAPIDLAASRAAGNTVRDWANNYGYSLPNYFRFDTGIRYRKNKGSRSWVLSLDIQNVTNRDNVFRQFYNPRLDQVSSLTQLGLIPIINYRLEF
ncbi:TonB-dependent receptor [Neolewinella agarilytica]|uniref:Outer membrane receptor proteins, mostly Fe transport n=1 Tax=Neolewinella agarilytica TaxID=478744 RepID=A0A1H9BMZ6_9BACT|nr:carboxypeptidase-like regulatory domain-containing protein [Neolewinella agarilytica]SEP90131.1 Outer membrane receptor proteins, mostly Fe transport [Neolewinella agarilytica]